MMTPGPCFPAGGNAYILASKMSAFRLQVYGPRTSPAPMGLEQAQGSKCFGSSKEAMPWACLGHSGPVPVWTHPVWERLNGGQGTQPQENYTSMIFSVHGTLLTNAFYAFVPLH